MSGGDLQSIRGWQRPASAGTAADPGSEHAPRSDPRRRDRVRGWHPALGAHWSIAGGLHLALEEAHRHRAGAVQIFSKTSGQWKAKPLDPDAVRQFRETDRRLGPFEMAVHDS